MIAAFLLLLFQSALLLPPRTAIENPAGVAQIPPKIEKDYGKLWARFVAANEDAKLVKDLNKFIQKQKNLDPAWMIEGYLALYKGDDNAARENFTRALSLNSNNRIAMYYLAELAYAHGEYARAATLYAQLQSLDSSRPELETKRQKAFLLATDALLRGAAQAEGASRLGEAEDYYRQALKLAPNEPVLHARFADLLTKENKKDEAESERKTADELASAHTAPRGPAAARARDEVKNDDLEDLGRWGGDIATFRQIRDSETLTREQLAILIVRYFPQVSEFRQNPQILTDIQASPARSEIQTVAGIGLMEPLPNHDFEPAMPVTRGELATALARLSRLLSVPASQASPITAPDLTPSNAMYPDVQLVLGYSIMSVGDSGSFNAEGPVSGGEGVRSIDRLLRTFQQVQR